MQALISVVIANIEGDPHRVRVGCGFDARPIDEGQLPFIPMGKEICSHEIRNRVIACWRQGQCSVSCVHLARSLLIREGGPEDNGVASRAPLLRRTADSEEVD